MVPVAEKKREVLSVADERTILLVEDELIFAQDLRNKLERAGFSVVGVACTGDEALAFVERTPLRLILMDIRLKGGEDGIETAQRILSRFDVPIIYLTAYADEETIARAKATSPYGYLLKPVDDLTLPASIEVALKKHEMERLLKEGEQWLRGTLRSLEDAVISTDAHGRVKTMNPRAELVTGVGEERAAGMPAGTLLAFNGGNVDPLGLALREGRSVSCTTRVSFFVSASHVSMPVNVSASPIFSTSGALVGAVLVLRDLTESEEMQRRLLERDEDLRKSLLRLEESVRDTVRTMAKLVEVRDPYTAGHQRRVAELAKAIAEKLELGKETVDAVFMASLTHDIGKIKIPSEILSKPGKLTDIEYMIIKTHPEVGAEILGAVRLPWPLDRIVHQHHERLNGSGYPRGLCGDSIMVEARVLAVADVVEAMFSHRPYRPSLGIESALGEVRSKAGSLYDPHIAGACCALFDEGFAFLPETG